MAKGKNLTSKLRGRWYRAGVAFTIAATAAFAAPGYAYATSIDTRALDFVQDGMDKLAVVCGFIGGGFIGWGLMRIASTVGDGQGVQVSAGVSQIGGGVLAFLVAGTFAALPSLLQ